MKYGRPPALPAFLVALGCAGCAHSGGTAAPPAAGMTSGRSPGTFGPGGVWFSGAPPVRIVLQGRTLGISPDGLARWLVRVGFVDAAGKPTKLLRGGDVSYVSSSGDAQWQTRSRFDAAAVIVSTSRDGPLSMLVRPNLGFGLAAARAATDTRRWRRSRVVAAALGPRLVQIGWFPSTLGRTVRIFRGEGHGRLALLGLAAPPAATFRDGTVRPGKTYRYRVEAATGERIALTVRVPPAFPRPSLGAAGGKAMWLAFSPSLADADSYATLDPQALVARAVTAGLHAIQLRTAYGAYREITPAAKPVVDALLDQAAAKGIATIGWCVPRTTRFDDLAAAVATAAYRTPKGNGFAALAIDLERGDEYLGTGAQGYAALTDYLRLLRAALGPGYPLIATVEDPYFEKLSNAAYPYAAIAASADVLQPMAYWRMLSSVAVEPAAVRAALRASYAALRREAGRGIPIDIGGQTSGAGPRGAPPPAEIAASVSEARALGAAGITFYDWRGTSAAQWDALARSRW